MDTTSNRKLNSALALTKTQTIQDYHVFAYIIANDLTTTDEENPVLGSIIILASFSNYTDGSGKEKAINYAKDLIAISGYDLIFWTDSHKWFNLKRRPSVAEVCYVDDKSGLENSSNFINFKLLNQIKQENTNFKESIEEEKRLHRARCNPDHVEHFIGNLLNLNDAFKSITEHEKSLETAKIAYEEHKQNLQMHYQKHPNHEEDALTLLKSRLKIEDYLPVAYTYSKIKEEVETHKIYEKKASRNNSSDGKESYSDVVSGSSEKWVTPSRNNKRRNSRKK